MRNTRPRYFFWTIAATALIVLIGVAIEAFVLAGVGLLTIIASAIGIIAGVIVLLAGGLSLLRRSDKGNALCCSW